MQSGGRKTSPRTSIIVQFIFYFCSFEISVNILRNQKQVISLDSYSRQVYTYLDPVLIYISLWIDCLLERTSMLKARVFTNYKNLIRIIWFYIVLTANTCSLHENQHYHVWSSMVYVKQAMASTLLLALVAIVFTPNNVKTISIFIVILH